MAKLGHPALWTDDTEMDNCLVSEFTLVLRVSLPEANWETWNNVIEYHHLYQREIRNAFKNGYSVVQRLKYEAQKRQRSNPHLINPGERHM